MNVVIQVPTTLSLRGFRVYRKMRTLCDLKRDSLCIQPGVQETCMSVVPHVMTWNIPLVSSMDSFLICAFFVDPLALPICV